MKCNPFNGILFLLLLCPHVLGLRYVVNVVRQLSLSGLGFGKREELAYGLRIRPACMYLDLLDGMFLSNKLFVSSSNESLSIVNSSKCSRKLAFCWRTPLEHEHEHEYRSREPPLFECFLGFKVKIQ